MSEPPAKLGKYQILRELGRGAMGVVYEAFDTVIERPVALKMLRTDLYAPEQLPDVRARFKREAHSAGRLSHPHIVTIFDYGEHEGTPYIAMDLMTGEELSRSLESGARMGLPQVVRVMEQLLGALTYAHEAGVVHRDIKPSNVFVLRDGSIKVVDFGLARIEASNLTETGTLLGTPAYMSPEQFLGLPVDARSDLFSTGVILYQMLTGDRPFTGSPTTIMQKVLRQDPVEPSVLNPTLSAAWDDLVKRALAKKPDERYQRAIDLLKDLKALKIEGLDQDWAAELPGFNSADLALSTAGRLEATQQLRAVGNQRARHHRESRPSAVDRRLARRHHVDRADREDDDERHDPQSGAQPRTVRKRARRATCQRRTAGAIAVA